MPITIENIQQAATIIAPYTKQTPCLPASMLSEILGAQIHLKLEHLQYTGSFKVRGAAHKILSLTESQRKQGVIACSAGNHAQGVAYIAGKLGIKATIVMPKTTPYTKTRRTENLGATVILHGENFDEAAKHSLDIAQQENLVFIHPYNDETVIAGQGTIGLEMSDALKNSDILLLPIGGGGLASGISIATHAINPKLKIIGVQTENVPPYHHHFKKMPPAKIFAPTLAEGIAVKQTGNITKPILDKHLHDMLLIKEDMIEHAIWLLNVKEKIVAEGAGAACVAAIAQHDTLFQNKNVATLICGGNIDSFLQSSVLMRGLVKQGNIFEIVIGARDRPGILAQITKIIGEQGANILEVNHQRLNKNMPLMMAEIHISLEVKDIEHLQIVKKALADNEYEVSQ